MQAAPVRRSAEVSDVVDAARRWAQGDDRISALALVGSWASGRATDASDVDLIVLSARPSSLLDDSSWFGEFGPVELVRTGRFGAVGERRLRRPSGLEIEVCVAGESWAATAPVDPGTRHVVDGGLQVLFDARLVLADLLAVVNRRVR